MNAKTRFRPAVRHGRVRWRAGRPLCLQPILRRIVQTQKETDPPLWQDVAVLAGQLAILPAMLCLRGLIFTTVWRWFAVPLGAPSIGLAMAIGIICLTGLLMSYRKPETRTVVHLAGAAGVWVVLLVTAWISRNFI